MFNEFFLSIPHKTIIANVTCGLPACNRPASPRSAVSCADVEMVSSSVVNLDAHI